MLACKRNLGTPFFDGRYLRSIKEVFGDRAEILTVTKNGTVVCSVMSFRFRNEILPYYGGGGDIARALKGNDYMYWAVMEKACKEGVEVFDYGRSMIGSGAYRFKKHWGFEPVPLEYVSLPIQKQVAPNLSPSNPKYRFLIETWKRLPLGVAGKLGPPIARRLG
jgi:FemAB-related protein (PEP-CTERM system-associated)